MEEYINISHNIKRIICLSDIHIKNNVETDDEYYNVFNQLKKTLIEQQIDNDCLIVLLGDILDNGYLISSTGIKMLKSFYKMLSDFCETITVLGNHDIRENVDIVSPILKEFETKNKNHILTDNKTYIYGNLAFVNTRYDAKQVTTYENIDGYITISLYHGIIGGAKINDNYYGNTNIKLSDFKTDYGFFGDIHMHQFLNKDKTHFYVGSLIQQNVTETYPHGIVLVDIQNKVSTYCEIKNKYRKMVLYVDSNGSVEDENIDNILKDIKYADVRIIYGSNDRKGETELKQKFLDYDVLITNYITNFKCKQVSIDTKTVIDNKNKLLMDINNKNDFIDFYLSYVKENHNIEDTTSIKKTLIDLVDMINIDEHLKPKRKLEFKELLIDNIMIFGKVHIDFNNLNKLTGLCETNSMGKSSLCEMISLCLFGKTPRCKTSSSFIRQGQTKGSCTLKILSNGCIYVITRRFVKNVKNKQSLNTDEYIHKKENCNEYVEYVKYLDTITYEAYINDICNVPIYVTQNTNFIGKTKKEIEELIEKNIISYDEIYENIVISQNRCNSFIFNKDKVDTLFKISNLSYLSKITDIATTMITHNKSLLKKNNNDIAEEFKNNVDTKDMKYVENIMEQKHNKLLQELDTINTELSDIEKTKNSLDMDIMICRDRIDKLNITDNNIDNINVLRDYIKTFNNDSITKEINSNERKIKVLYKKINEYGNIEEEKQKYEDDKKQSLKQLNDELNSYLRKLKENSKKLTTQQYNKLNKTIIECKTNVDNLTKEINLTKQILISKNDRNVFINYITYINKENEIKILNKSIETYDNILLLSSTKKITNYVETQKDIIKKQLDVMKKDLLDIIDYKNKYDMCLSDEYNDELLNELSSKLDIERNKLYSFNNELSLYENYVYNKDIEKHIEELNNSIDKLTNTNFTRYDKYIICKNEYDELENKTVKLKLTKEQNLTEYITKKNIYEKILHNKEQYEILCNEKTKLEKRLNDKDNVSLKYDIIKNKKKEIDIKMSKFNDKYILSKSTVEKNKKIINDIDNLTTIQKTLSVEGITNKIMKHNILPQLNQTMDDICKYIGHEKIYLKMIELHSNSNKKYDIIISTKQCHDIANIGGFASNILELICKLSFLRVNAYFDCSFIIIDEIFDACSDTNIKMAIKLVEFFKVHYEKMIVVSHNNAIISTFDKRLKIMKNGDNGNFIETV